MPVVRFHPGKRILHCQIHFRLSASPPDNLVINGQIKHSHLQRWQVKPAGAAASAFGEFADWRREVITPSARSAPRRSFAPASRPNHCRDIQQSTAAFIALPSSVVKQFLASMRKRQNENHFQQSGTSSTLTSRRSRNVQQDQLSASSIAFRQRQRCHANQILTVVEKSGTG